MDAVRNGILILSLIGLAACGQPSTVVSQKVAASLSGAVGCSQFQSQFWDQMYQNAENESQPLALETIRQEVESRVRSEDGSLLHAQAISGAIVQAVSAVNEALSNSDHVLTREERLANVGKLEIGVKDSTQIQQAQNKLETAMVQLDQARSEVHMECLSSGTPAPVEASNAYFAQLRASRVPASYGAAKVMATAYQQCQTLKLPPLTAAVPTIQGISIVGTNGAGFKRVISNLGAVQKTHPYIQNFQAASNACVSVPKSPLIYDFGGKPYATAAANATLNLFKSAGSGSPVLGVDCSGFIFSSLASAGLKMRSDRDLRAAQVYSFGSASFYDPKANGADCLQPVAMNAENTIQAGDIVGGSGHVIMIESVDADPFGIASAQTIKDCANVTSKNFHFTIAQSSPSQGGVGINHYVASEYLAGEATYRNGLETYAKYACYSKFQKQAAPSLKTIRIVRHTGTPQCIAPEIALESSACLANCSL